MILSVLIPSITERRAKLLSLTNELYRQILNLQTVHPDLGSVELIIDDSKKFTEGGLSIGAKRDALLHRAGGEYVCFLDDDDLPEPNYIETLVRLCNEGNDIVTFRCLVKNDYYTALADMSLATQVNEEINPHGVKMRTPWHICPVRAEIAKGVPFTDINHNEDWTWMKYVLRDVKTESHTDMILTTYVHSESGSEADRIVRPVAMSAPDRALLISLAVNGRENYLNKSIKLEESLSKWWVSDLRLYKSYPDYCTPNSVIPYKFKYDLIRRAREDGYNQVFWLDSSIRLANWGSSLLELFPESGIIAFDNLGHPLWKYISDKAMANLNVGNSEVERIPQTWGGALGFDFTKDKACEVFEEICRHSMNGSFETSGSRRKGFVAHRHDQATISVILWKHKIKLLPYGEIVTAEHARTGEYGTDFKLIYGNV